jgi:hypothetical protein
VGGKDIRRVKIVIDWEIIEQVTEFKYLGNNFRIPEGHRI